MLVQIDQGVVGCVPHRRRGIRQQLDDVGDEPTYGQRVGAVSAETQRLVFREERLSLALLVEDVEQTPEHLLPDLGVLVREPRNQLFEENLRREGVPLEQLQDQQLGLFPDRVFGVSQSVYHVG
jgi:hypothetical protein